MKTISLIFSLFLTISAYAEVTVKTICGHQYQVTDSVGANIKELMDSAAEINRKLDETAKQNSIESVSGPSIMSTDNGKGICVSLKLVSESKDPNRTHAEVVCGYSYIFGHGPGVDEQELIQAAGELDEKIRERSKALKLDIDQISFPSILVTRGKGVCATVTYKSN